MTGGEGSEQSTGRNRGGQSLYSLKALQETHTVTTHRYSDTEVLPAVFGDEGEHKEDSAMKVSTKVEHSYRYKVMVCCCPGLAIHLPLI